MDEYVILYDKRGLLDIQLASHAVAAVTRMLGYKGQCMYLPFPDGKKGRILLMIDEKDATESETDWFLRRLAGYLSVDAFDQLGTPMFEDSEDNDTAFLDVLPPPEQEAQPIRVTAVIDGITDSDVTDSIFDFFEDAGFETLAESDGLSIFLAINSFLDIFYKPGEPTLTMDIDCTFSGAGIYADAVALMEGFAAKLGLSAAFTEYDGITYTTDRDFDKLRKAFYTVCAQHLAFAVFEDRDGFPAYFGWGTDSYEPEHIPGSLITVFGRLEISKILSEIERYGFSYVCDTRFLVRNTPEEGGDYFVREAMNLIWNCSFTVKDDEFSMIEYASLDQCRRSFELALETDPYVSFPRDCYRKACLLCDKPMKDISNTQFYDNHYPVGYMRGDVYYGFGHYLRRFKLPGRLCRTLAPRDANVTFFGDSRDGIRIECEVNYGFDGDTSKSPLGSNFAVGDPDSIEIFDIGGSSVVRFLDGGKVGECYRAEAEVYIRDEVYRFAMSCFDHDDILNFRDSVRDSLNVEDWYDDYNFDGMPDPHANGATFCMNIVAPPLKVFAVPFPITDEFFSDPHTVPYPMTPEAKTAYEKQFLNGGIPDEIKNIMETFLRLTELGGSEGGSDGSLDGSSDENRNNDGEE